MWRYKTIVTLIFFNIFKLSVMLNKLWETFSLITWVELVVISDFSYLDMNNIARGFENI